VLNQVEHLDKRLSALRAAHPKWLRGLCLRSAPLPDQLSEFTPYALRRWPVAAAVQGAAHADCSSRCALTSRLGLPTPCP
jgi:hypothetical protein